MSVCSCKGDKGESSWRLLPAKREALRWGYWPDKESWWQHLDGYPLLCRGRT